MPSLDLVALLKLAEAARSAVRPPEGVPGRFWYEDPSRAECRAGSWRVLGQPWLGDANLRVIQAGATDPYLAQHLFDIPAATELVDEDGVDVEARDAARVQTLATYCATFDPNTVEALLSELLLLRSAIADLPTLSERLERMARSLANRDPQTALLLGEAVGTLDAARVAAKRNG